MHEPPSSKVQRLLDILERTDDTADNLQALQRHHERRGAGDDGGVLGQADGDEGAAWPQERGRRLIALPRRRGDDDAVRAVLGQGHDLGRNVLAGGEVNVRLGASAPAQVALLVATVDSDDAHPHRLGVLHGKVAEAATGPGQHDPLARSDGAALARRVRGDAAAHDGPGFFVRHAVGDARRVLPVCNAVFLDHPQRRKHEISSPSPSTTDSRHREEKGSETEKAWRSQQGTPARLPRQSKLTWKVPAAENPLFVW